MPVYSNPKLRDFYQNTAYLPLSTSILKLTPPDGYVLTSDGNGATSYNFIPNINTFKQYLFSSINAYSMTVFGENTFTCQGSTIFLGSVYISTNVSEGQNPSPFSRR